MAILTIRDLSLEVAYRTFEDGWVMYDIWFRWKGEPIVNDAILKRHNDHWGARGVGAVNACEHRGCGMLPLLRRVLETNKADYWQSSDPDVLLAVYPDGGLPFLPSKSQLVWESAEIKAERETREREKAEKGKLPDDSIEIILFVDVYNLAGCHHYYGDGLCFRITPQRWLLERFYDDLRAEYVEFKRTYQTDEFNREELGPEYWNEWF